MMTIVRTWDIDRCPGVNHHGMQCRRRRKTMLSGAKATFCGTHGKQDKPHRIYPTQDQLERLDATARAEYE